MVEFGLGSIEFVVEFVIHFGGVCGGNGVRSPPVGGGGGGLLKRIMFAVFAIIVALWSYQLDFLI